MNRRTLATATGQDKLHHSYFSPYPQGFVVAKDLSEISSLIDEETCGVMIELIQGEGGIKALPKEEVQKSIISESLKNALVILQSGKDVVRFLPPLTIRQEEIKEGFERLRGVLEGMRR